MNCLIVLTLNQETCVDILTTHSKKKRVQLEINDGQIPFSLSCRVLMSLSLFSYNSVFTTLEFHTAESIDITNA